MVLYLNRWRMGFSAALCAVAAIIFAPVLFNGAAQAEQPFDCLCCGFEMATIISVSQDLTILRYEGEGNTFSNHENNIFDDMTFHCVGITRAMRDKLTSNLICNHLDADGDLIVVEICGAGAEMALKFLKGTGKWKGITGGGKALSVTSSNPKTPGRFYGCRRVIGKLNLPK